MRKFIGGLYLLTTAAHDKGQEMTLEEAAQALAAEKRSSEPAAGGKVKAKTVKAWMDSPSGKPFFPSAGK